MPVDLAGSRDYARELRARAGAAALPATPAAAEAQDQAVLHMEGPEASSHAGPEAGAVAGANAGPRAAPAPSHPAAGDARALRRLFLELPCLMCRVRMAALPQGQGLFRQQQALLGRLDLVSLAAGTMPALALAAPGQPLGLDGQLRRARHSQRAVAALDEAWALLARFELADDAALAGLLDEADRIVANLEHAIDGRKRVAAMGEAA